VRFADEAVHIGPPATAKSYLNIPNLIGAALKTGADALHPGYGFLSEDPDFAEICEESGIAFIGPSPEVMVTMGNKATARDLMTKAGLPLLPGTIEPVTTVDEAQEIAAEIGYPLIIKAAAGGGGRGMTVVERVEDLKSAYQDTRATAQAIFKDSAVYIERFLAESRHTEIQVLCDNYGNGIHLGERDCSVQRRHQKLIEESPSPAVDPELRARMGAAAVQGALAVNYSGVGTMEFLLDNDGNFSFMEMNARIQVEHPVTEAVTGIDLVKEQIKVRAGERLAITQDDVKLTGHAIECRINAESPETFAPAPGRLEKFVSPGGPWTRVDSHCFPGWVVSPYYDSLIAKLIVWAPDREEAVERMRRALGEFQIEGPGIKTTIPFHERVFAHPVFRSGDFTTNFLEQNDLTSTPGEKEA
jgi:acetyl-CoA carboxylase biotin carboxylase subunit